MKRTILLGILLGICLSIFAQEEFKPVQTVTYPFKITSKTINPSHTLVLISDTKQIAMMDAVSCKVKWSLNLNEKFKIEKAEYCGISPVNDTVWIVYKDNKERKTISLSPETGEKIAGPVVEQPTSKEKVSYRNINHTFSSPENGVTISVNYRAKLIVSSASSSEAILSVSCDGKYKWSQTVNAKVMRTLYSNSGMTREMADYLTAYVQGDKLFIVYDGFSVLDIASGKILWEAGFDYVNFDFGLTKCKQEFPKAPFPYCDNKVVYVTDMHKNVQKLLALDANSGKKIWESEKYDDDAMVSNMFFINNTIINQFGGRIFSQIYKAGVGSGSRETWLSGFAFPTDGGFKSYDAITGKLLWSTYDKAEFSSLKKKSTNSLVKDNNIFVATEKELFSIDALTGKLNLSTPISKLEIGIPQDISFLNNNIFIQATEGYAMFTTDGKLVYKTPTKEILETTIAGSTYVVWIGENITNLNTFICFDPLTGKIAGKMKDTAYPYFSASGDAFIKFDGNKEMLRYKVY